MKNTIRLAAAILFAGIASIASAQDFPTAPIHLIIGYPPGTAADLSARVIGNRMSQTLGQQIVVENKAGAGSSLAAGYVARAAKDGYTLYVGNAANPINAAMTPNLPFDFYKDFAPVALITSTPTVLVVTPESGIKSVKELIAYAKANPGKLSFGSSGVGSSTHLALELFKYLAKVDITHIPYSGSPQVITDMLANRIQGYFSPASTVMGQVQTGKLVGLAVTDPKRSPFMANLPTMIEAGVPDFESVLWFGIEAPAGTPKPIIDKLASATNEALKNDDVIKALQGQTLSPLGGTPEEFSKFIDGERKRWTAVVEGAGLRK
jgi:tripartite-type tricarboxylate transporter receptor subunit TctC